MILCSLDKSRNNFNPRAREGRDPCPGERSHDLRYFNPRAREGRDVAHVCSASRNRNFNPRAREGRDGRCA